MSRLENVRENWTEITDKLLRDKQLLAHFIRFSAGMYKQSFSDAALIYQQNPYATKVATLETWNKLGRLVNRSERSMAVFGEDNRAKHLFDISQTNGKRIPDLWKLTEDIADELTAVINKKYGKDCKNIHETIAAMSVDNTRTHLTEMMYATQPLRLPDSEMKTYQQSFVSAVRFMVSNRCELGSDMKISGGINLNAVDLFKDTRDLIRFCDLVQKSAKDTLLEMEREIVQILKQRRELSNDLQAERNRADVGRGAVHGQSRRAEAARTADRQVGKDVAGMDTHGVSDRGTSIRGRGSVADNSEGNRHRGGEPLSGAGRAVQTEKNATDDIRGNSAVGENAAVDRGTSGNGGSRVPNEITVERLIERYNKADFNRRWDSYETAGWILSDVKAADFRLDAVEQFDKYHADKFSVAQAEEIRGLIRAALENREKTHDFIDVSVPDEPPTVEERQTVSELPIEEEPSDNYDFSDDEDEVIINNSIIETSDLPPLTDEKLICDILKYDRFFKIKREEIAEFFSENMSSTDRAELLKKAFNPDYTEFDIGTNRGGFKANENGVIVWQGHYLNRYKESGLSWDLVQSLTAKMIENGEYLDERRPQIVTDAQELIDGDTVCIDGVEWKVLSAGDYLISLKNSEGEQRNLYNTLDKKWYDLMNEHGFEFISSSDDDHKFFKPEDEIVEPLDDDEPEQLTLFGYDEPMDIAPTDNTKSEPQKKKSVMRRTVAYSNAAPNDEMINYILKCGGNDRHTLERIVAQFQKGKSDVENAEFLRKEFCSRYDEDGRGYKFVAEDFTSSALLAAWFDESGITAAINNTAFPHGEKTHLTWEQVSEKISAMLERGEYCEQDIIDRAAENELTDIAAKLWYLHQDFSEEYRDKKIIPYTGIFPDDIVKIKTGLTDKSTLQGYIDGMEKFLKDYEENREILRFGFHRPKELLSRLKDLQIPRKEFITNSDFKFEPKFFITEDEKDWVVAGGGNVQGSKFRIAKYFSEGHSAKEKADFIKHEYGEGGSLVTGYGTSYNAKGFKFHRGSISNPDAEVLMKWNDVAERVMRMIADERYITQKNIDARIRNAKQDFANNGVDNEYEKAVKEDARKILAEYGIDVDEPVPALDENSRDAAVFLDTLRENYVAVAQTDEGIDYTVYAPDLTPIDGGVWEMDSAVDLKFAAAQLLDTAENNLAEISDYEKFIDLADMDYDLSVAAELNNLKAAALGNMDSPVLEKRTEDVSEKSSENTEEISQTTDVPKFEQPTVNAPEKITAVKKAPKSGTPFTYHFNEKDVVTGGAKSKFNANVEAIKALQKIEAENRYATPEEQSILARYVGWGGIPQAFTTDRAAEGIGNLGEAAPTGWENEQQQLRELLSQEEYAAARASTLTSFYTPPEVTDGVYQALEQFGFEGGNVLEPSMGVGNFFSKMPDNIRNNSRLYGVELDSISGRIAQQLYPNERIQIKGFEQTNFNNNSFDVVVGNIPFGDYKVTDRNYDKLNFKIHDYFAAKSVDKVKPGGVVALVTSKFTMDKKNEKARRYLAERCDLLGAVRLPNTAFKGEVTTITINKADISRYEAAVEKVKQSYRQNNAPERGYSQQNSALPQYQQNVPNQNYQQNFQQPTNPNVIGNTPYNQLGGKGQLEFYTNLKNRHADNVAKQLDEDGVRFSGLRKGTVTTITINKADIPRYEAALAKVKQMYDKLNNRSAQIPETAFREQIPKPKPSEPPRTDIPEMSKDEPSSFKTVPICTQSLMEAKQSGNLGAWKDSVAASKACIKFIEDNLSVAYEGRDLENFVKQLNDKFGIDRAMYSVAATIQLKDHDGRFTNEVKNRAAQFGFDSDNMRLNFLTERHPVMINHLYQQMMEMEQVLRLNAPEQEQKLSAIYDEKFLYSSERVKLNDDFRGIPETKYYKSSANEFFIPEIGWLDDAAYNRELKNSDLTSKDFYATVTRVNANYIDGMGMTGQMDMSRAEYDSMLEKTYAPENAEALKSALGKLDERRNEANIPEKPTEYFAVRQVSERRYAVCSISADGLVTTAKPNITSITEAKKAMLEIFEQKKGSAKVEFVHPQTLDEISAKMYNERAQEELPDIMYRINLNSDKKSADTHVLQEYVKNDEGKYSVGQEVAKGDYEKCNKFLAQLMNAPKIEPPKQTHEIYQLKSGGDMHGLRFMPYDFITKNGGKPEFANYEKVYEGNAADLSGNLGEKLESLFEKFNLDRPEDFKGHSLSVSDVVVLEDKACYVDVVGFRYLEDFVPLEVKQSRFYDELLKRLSDIAEGKVSPLQDNLLKVGNDALRLNVPPYIMREAAFRSGDERIQKLADTYEKMCERKHSAPNHEKSELEEYKPQRKPKL